jgi:Sec-independent protein translocase protein TatA
MFNIIQNISTTELGIIVVILLVLFGAGFVKRIARTSGETVKEVRNLKKEFHKAVEGES